MKRFGRYILLLAVVAVVVAVDQLTKIWADRSLASDEHPLVVPLPDASGATLKDAVLAEWPDLGGDDPAAFIRRYVTKVPAKAGLDPDGPAYVHPWTDRSILGYHVFHRQDRELAPRRLLLVEPLGVARWLRYVLPGWSDDKRRDAVWNHYAKITLTRFLLDRCAAGG